MDPLLNDIVEEIPESCGKCSINTDEKTIHSEPVFTPYFRPLGNDYPTGCELLPQNNYSPYNLWCLTTKLLVLLDEEFSGCYPRYQSYEYLNVMRLCVVLYDGSRVFPLNKKQAQQVQGYVDKCCGELQDWCVLFSSKLFSVSQLQKGFSRDQGWVRSILPFLNVPLEYESKVVDGTFYLKLDPESAYDDDYNTLSVSLDNSLDELWNFGAIVVNPHTSGSFLNRWKLSPYIGIQDVRIGDALVYIPSWNDSRFAPSKVDFLKQRLMGEEYISIALTQWVEFGLYSRRHSVAMELENKHIARAFSRNFVFVEANSYERAHIISDLVSRALENIPSKVALINMINSEGIIMETNRIKKSIVEIFPQGNPVVYETDLSPLNMCVSFVIPNNLTEVEALNLVSLDGGDDNDKNNQSNETNESNESNESNENSFSDNIENNYNNSSDNENNNNNNENNSTDNNENKRESSQTFQETL